MYLLSNNNNNNKRDISLLGLGNKKLFINLFDEIAKKQSVN